MPYQKTRKLSLTVFIFSVLFLLYACQSTDIQYDLIIADGKILNGSGEDVYEGDIGIIADKIVSIGDLDHNTCKEVIVASGLYVSPGFIDVHSHAASGLVSKDISDAKALFLQGLTTVFVNPDGGGALYLDSQKIDLLRHYLGINVAQMVPNGTIGREVIGMKDRLASEEEIGAMQDILKREMERDALVVSLESIPDFDASPLGFQEFYDIYKNMAAYVDSNYTTNTSRTFIGKGSEGGVVMQTLFRENPETSIFDKFICTDSPRVFNANIVKMIDENSFPIDKKDKRFHFSFSSSNDFNDCTNLINKIKGAQYTWLDFGFKEYKNLTYENAYKTAFSDGLRFVFK